MLPNYLKNTEGLGFVIRGIPVIGLTEDVRPQLPLVPSKAIRKLVFNF